MWRHSGLLVFGLSTPNSSLCILDEAGSQLTYRPASHTAAVTQMMTCPYGHYVAWAQLRHEGNNVICPVCYPTPVATSPSASPARRIAAPWLVVLATATLVGVALIATGVILAFSALPKQTFDAADAWCGPGTTSSSAVSVRLHPDSVNSGGSSPTNLTPAQQQIVAQDNAAFKSFCQHVADQRLEESVVMFGPGLVFAGAAAVLALARPRWLRD
jgi:hypothetical protein